MAGAVRRVVRGAGVAAVTLALGSACGCSAAKPPEGPVVPTPTSVTRDNPGGDARDPLYASLVRLRDERWSKRNDRFRTVDVPLADAPRWLRVRFWGYPTRVGFRYGNDHMAVAVVLYDEAPPGEDTPKQCLERFVDRALRVAKGFDVAVGELHYGSVDRLPLPVPRPRRGPPPAPLLPVYAPGPVPLVSTDGHFDTLMDDDNYLAAVAAYPSFPGTCLLHGFAVETGEHVELARQVVERWVHEGAPAFNWTRGLKAAPARENR